MANKFTVTLDLNAAARHVHSSNQLADVIENALSAERGLSRVHVSRAERVEPPKAPSGRSPSRRPPQKAICSLAASCEKAAHCAHGAPHVPVTSCSCSTLCYDYVGPERGPQDDAPRQWCEIEE